MMTPNPGLSDLVHDLRATLEHISEALVEGLPERLLETEPRLAQLAERLCAAAETADISDRDEIVEARAALHRCAHLGATIRSLGELYASASAGGYDRTGRCQAPGASGALEARG